MIFGVDYSWGRPGVPALKKAGVRFACRYLSADAGKAISAEEARALHAAGIAVVLVFENGGQRALAGSAAGAADARAARQMAAGVGARQAPVYFAVDFDVQPGQVAAVKAYIAAAAAVLGPSRTGVYGGIRIVQACLDAHACRFGWQTNAWSAGKWDERAHIRQDAGTARTLGGVGVDYNYATVSDYGQWSPPAKKPTKRRLLPSWLRWGHI